MHKTANHWAQKMKEKEIDGLHPVYTDPDRAKTSKIIHTLRHPWLNYNTHHHAMTGGKFCKTSTWPPTNWWLATYWALISIVTTISTSSPSLSSPKHTPTTTKTKYTRDSGLLGVSHKKTYTKLIQWVPNSGAKRPSYVPTMICLCGDRTRLKDRDTCWLECLLKSTNIMICGMTII